VILTGWKQISTHLGYGIRTAQRWQRQGLPVKRVTGSKRSPVVADSEELDAWILRGRVLPSGAPANLWRNLQRARELQRAIEKNRKEFQLKLEALRKGLAEFRSRRGT
jgi:hypothetical protein